MIINQTSFQQGINFTSLVEVPIGITATEKIIAMVFWSFAALSVMVAFVALAQWLHDKLFWKGKDDGRN